MMCALVGSAVCWLLQGARAKLSQDLVALWADDYPPALALLRRVFPPGLLRFLQQKRSPSVLSRPTSPTPQMVRPTSLPTPGSMQILRKSFE